MEENKVKAQKDLLEGAGVYAYYYKKESEEAKWHCVIKCGDPDLFEFCQICIDWLNERNVPAKLYKGKSK
jgi:hypothetical protein